MSEGLIEAFAEHGGLFGLILGLLITGLISAVVVLWRSGVAKEGRIERLQDLRVQESRETADHILKQNLKLQEVASSITNAMESLRDAVILSRRSEHEL